MDGIIRLEFRTQLLKHVKEAIDQGKDILRLWVFNRVYVIPLTSETLKVYC
jgi:hypothetical protein